MERNSRVGSAAHISDRTAESAFELIRGTEGGGDEGCGAFVSLDSRMQETLGRILGQLDSGEPERLKQMLEKQRRCARIYWGVGVLCLAGAALSIFAMVGIDNDPNNFEEKKYNDGSTARVLDRDSQGKILGLIWGVVLGVMAGVATLGFAAKQIFAYSKALDVLDGKVAGQTRARATGPQGGIGEDPEVGSMRDDSTGAFSSLNNTSSWLYCCFRRR